MADLYDQMFEELDTATGNTPDANEAYWRKKLASQGTLKAPPPRSAWRRFMENIEEGMRRGPGSLIATTLAPLVETGDNLSYNERRKAFARREKQRRADFAVVDPADSIGDYASDIAGNIAGSLISDPTNLVGGGAKTLGRKMLTASGVGAGSDLALQGAEVLGDVRDEIDPRQVLLNAAASPLFVAGAHGLGKAWDKFGPKRAQEDVSSVREEEDPIDRRIRGLDDLAKHPNTPKHEAAAARRMAEKLRTKYGRPGQPVMEDFDFNPKPLSIEDAASFGKRFGTVTSTRRTAARNKAVGGVPTSYHLSGRAMDIARKKGVSHKSIEAALRSAGYNIVESIDEGDHSHFAFDFRKSAPTIQQPDDLGDIRLVQDELPAIDEMARVNETLFQQADDTVVPFPKEKLPELTEDELRDILSKQGQDDFADVLTPAERQEMDASVPTPPAVRGALSEDILDSAIGKGGTATTPVNDLKNYEINPKDLFVELEKPGHYGITYHHPSGAKITADLVKKGNGVYDIDIGGIGTDSNILGPGMVRKLFREIEKRVPDLKSINAERITGARMDNPQYTTINVPFDRSVPPPTPPFPPRPGEEPDPDFRTTGGPFGGDGGSPVEPDDLLPVTIDKLVDAVKLAKKAGPEHRKAQLEERRKRFAEVSRRRQYTKGAKGLYAEKGALKGELPRVDLEPIRFKFSQEERDTLLDALKNSRLLSMGESIHARDAIEGLMDGRLPTPSELSYLDRVFPVLVEQIHKKAPFKKKVEKFLWKTYETSRGQMGSGDISFGGRQGLMMFSRPEWWKATWGELHALSPTEGKQVLQDQTERIVNSPHYERLKTAGVKLMDLGDHGSREEYAPHGLIEDIPYVGGITKASNRAYTYMSNELRFRVASNRLDDYKNKGADIDDPDFLKTFGEYINTFTGRGNFPKIFGFDFNKSRGVSMAANLVLFAPKFVMSTLQRMNPLFWARMAKHPLILKSALRDATAYVLLMFGLLQGADKLLDEAGYEVEWDPRSPTGLKIKHGNTTYDFGGGMVQSLSLISKLLTNVKITGKGEEKRLDTDEFGGQGVWDTITDFARTKLHPSLAYIVNMREGQNVVGEKFDYIKDTAELLLPMYSMSLAEHLKEYGLDGLAAALPIGLGASINTFKPKPKKEKEPADPMDKMFKDLEKSDDEDELDKMFKELGQ